jgi:hypothetical protein
MSPTHSQQVQLAARATSATPPNRGTRTQGDVELKYGSNTEKVQDVLDFACRGPILNGTAHLADKSHVVVDDFDRAMCWARNQDIEEDGDEGRLTWEDVRSEEMAKVHEKKYALLGFDPVEPEPGELLTALFECLSDTVPPRYDAILNDVIGDLHGCAYARALDPAGNAFFERLLSIYRSGGWPCGWDGHYPDGKLVIFVPVNAAR